MDLDSKAGGSGDQKSGVGSPRSPPEEEEPSQPAVHPGPVMPSEPVVDPATIDEPAMLPLPLEQPAEDVRAAMLAKKGGALQAAPVVVRTPNKAARARCKFRVQSFCTLHTKLMPSTLTPTPLGSYTLSLSAHL